ncbi:MAG: carboxy-S-adenosyl-L-methionine synthase CmoA [Gammaproteobacteria bacterium]|nr:carboxy-S-adenosyl-L-methionine synthase CmoA [Gammaproteobacteria bacterium]
MTEDKIYSSGTYLAEPFRFDSTVAEVFPDMLRRSIPGYAATLEAIGSLASRYVADDTNCYDLGCSLGAATLAMRQGIRASGCQIIAIDNSTAMLERCEQIVAAATRAAPGTPVDIQLGDIRETAIANASMIVMNYTLQFLSRGDRDETIARIYEGLNPGGLLLLSEKVIDENAHMNRLLIDLHEEHKRRNNYSDLEISRKRTALEDVLVPESVSAHRQRLRTAGFAHSGVWLRYFNFVSIVAIK